MKHREESGVVLMAVVIILLPVIVTVGAFSSTMTSRTDRLVDEIDQEKALLAAESGIDLAIWAGQTGYLQHEREFSFRLSADTECTVRPTHLEVDGLDNDGDGWVDEDDEDVFQVEVTGTYRGVTRNLAAYLGPLPAPNMNVSSAVLVMNPDVDVDLRGTPFFIGNDTNLDGTLGDPANDGYGLAMAAPYTAADLWDDISLTEALHIVGTGGTGSVGDGPSVDIDSIVSFVQNSANVVLTNRRYSTIDFGSGLKNEATIAYREGDVKFSGDSHGAGILVVTGNLEVTGTFRFDGILIVLGDLEIGAGTVQIFGSLVQGSGATKLHTRGTLDVRYSSEAIAVANSVTGRYVAYNGWQELAR